jgi:hypothetical protein
MGTLKDDMASKRFLFFIEGVCSASTYPWCGILPDFNAKHTYGYFADVGFKIITRLRSSLVWQIPLLSRQNDLD